MATDEELEAMGPLVVPLWGLANLLAACPTFQAKVGAANATEALLRIHWPKVELQQDLADENISDDGELEDELVDVMPARPWALITDDDSCHFSYDAMGRSNGQILLTFEFLSNPELPVHSKAAFKDFCQAVGAILREMAERKNTPQIDGSYMWNSIKFTRVVAPALCDERKEATPNTPGNLFFEVMFMVDWV